MGAVLSRGDAAQIIEEQRAVGARIVFTNGIFDLLHLGHIEYLQRARALGDLLIIGVNSDDSTRRLKGPLRPVNPARERAQVVVALECVDYAVIFDETTAESLVAELRPDVYVKGGDYAGGASSHTELLLSPEELRATLEETRTAGLGERLPEAHIVASYGGSLALLPYLPDHSTTQLIERIVAAYAGATRNSEPLRHGDHEQA